MKPGLVAFPFCLVLSASAEEIRVEGARISRDFTCEDGQNVVIAGAGHKIALTGRCGELNVYGTNHAVSFESAGTLAVSGMSNVVEGGSAGKLVVEVTRNKVKTALKAADEPATADVSGAEQAVELTLAGPARIEVQGTKNVVEWQAANGVKPPAVSSAGIENRIARR